MLGASCSSQPEIMSTSPTSTNPYTSISPNQEPYGQYRTGTNNQTPNPNNSTDSTKSDSRHSDTPDREPSQDNPDAKIGSGRDESPSDLAPVVRPKNEANGTASGNQPNNKPGSTTNARASVGFDQVLPILKQSCNGCHNPNARNPDLTTYSRARAVGPAIVRTAASDSPTMPEGDPKLSEKDKAILRSWKDSGYIETSK